LGFYILYNVKFKKTCATGDLGQVRRREEGFPTISKISTIQPSAKTGILLHQKSQKTEKKMKK
jgi:hypothetical protein